MEARQEPLKRSMSTPIISAQPTFFTNASGTAVQILDFYPYGATRINSSVGGADSARKYIGQFADQSGLDTSMHVIIRVIASSS
jgi:hypothetical protein